MRKVAERRGKGQGRPRFVDPELRRLLRRLPEPATGASTVNYEVRSDAERRRASRLRPSDLEIPALVPTLYIPAAIVARLRREVGRALSPTLGWRHWCHTAQVHQLAYDRLGIRILGARMVIPCPTCGVLSTFLQLEERWRCQHCTLAPARGLIKRLAWLCCYLRLNLHDSHVRALRRRLMLRLLRLAPRTRNADHLVMLAVGRAVLGPWPLTWSGPRRPRVPRGSSSTACPPGPMRSALAAIMLDATIELVLHPAAYQRWVLGSSLAAAVQ